MAAWRRCRRKIPAHPQSGVVAQEPDPGEEVPDGDDVTISYETGGGVATVTPKVDASSVAPPPGDSEPLAYVRENRIFVRFPGEAEQSIGGTVGVVSTDPTWNPATGEIAYVRRRSPEAEAEVVAVDPRAPGGERPLTTPGRSYINPAFSPSGTLLALIADDGSGYGGQLCVDVLPGSDPGCRDDAHWHYAHPVFADDSALYVLRRRDSTTREGGWDELVRVDTDSFDVEGPLATGDLRSVAVARDGRIALVARHDGDAVLPRRGPLARGDDDRDRARAPPAAAAWPGTATTSSSAAAPVRATGRLVAARPERLRRRADRRWPRATSPRSRPESRSLRRAWPDCFCWRRPSPIRSGRSRTCSRRARCRRSRWPCTSRSCASGSRSRRCSCSSRASTCGPAI